MPNASDTELPEPSAAAPLASLERAELLRAELALSREWIETDGIGGYASATALACPARRQHGLLVARPEGHARRHVLLSRFEERVEGLDRSFPLSHGLYRGGRAADGQPALEAFELAPWPTWRYRIGLAVVTREVLVPRGRACVLVRYANRGERAGLSLLLAPLLAFRDADALTRENLDLDPRAELVEGCVRVRPYSTLPALYVAVDGAPFAFEADPVWYRGVEHATDLELGDEAHEDLFAPGWLRVPLEPGAELVVAASTAPLAEPSAALFRREAERRSDAARRAPADLGGRLALAAEHYLVAEPHRRAVAAGWPWHPELGRWTFVALPGLTLARGEPDEAGAVLEGALPYLRDGLLPSRFGAAPEDSEYAAVDVALWFARAVRMYELAGGSRERVRDAFAPALRAIADALAAGGPLGVALEPDGLLRAGDSASAVTWMDARRDGRPVTPRDGLAVEVQALWHFLHAYLAELEAEVGDAAAAARRAERRDAIGEAFVRRFWLAEDRYLADVVRDDRVDRAVRPNQVLAAMLEWTPLSRGRRTDVLRRAERELLTPFGLRTLAPKNPDYEGRHHGDLGARETARHQGSAWPWLLGPYVEASLRTHDPEPERLAALRARLVALDEHLDRQGLGHVSELADGDPPHRPGGAVASAVAVAECLRAWRLLEGAPR